MSFPKTKLIDGKRYKKLGRGGIGPSGTQRGRATLRIKKRFCREQGLLCRVVRSPNGKRWLYYRKK